MFLPEYVLTCMQALEKAGFQVYAVGGCVRDALLGLTPHDYDLCTDATPAQMHRVFAGYRLVESGEKHGTVGVILDHQVVEITTFRTEGGYADNRHPDWVRFVPHVEQDLARRDFTVNAIAYSPATGYVNPFGGQEDLQARILRCVGCPEQRFTEDALRILRGARFAARFQLTPDKATEQAMFALAPTMEQLARERVFEELCKLLLWATAEDLCRFAPIITAVIPELASQVGFDQRNPHHAFDLFSHTAHVTENAPAQLPMRWAGLLHDVGKVPSFTMDDQGRGHFYGHAKPGAAIADEILRRLKAPNALREEVVLLVQLHMTLIVPEKKIVRRWLSKLGPDMLDKLLTFQAADMGGKGIREDGELEQLQQIRELMAEITRENACFCLKDLAINGHDLMALGFQGKAIGNCLQQLLEQVMDEQLANSREALLAAAAEYRGDAHG